MNDTPKPCPNCKASGSMLIVLLFLHAGRRKVCCTECLMQGPAGDTEVEAIERWNGLPRRDQEESNEQ